ncbi:MAG: Rrf2 family transcriptional regulator [Lachnospiraceae bacterium]|nr:Rrf2 family transcriptional regulator [Lachnospiraceae bacterium]
MKVSTKGRYGIRALVDLAVNAKDGYITLVSIANRNQISVHYLEHVFASLKKAGIVKSVKGAQGGYFLGEDAKNITAEEIITALEGDYKIGEEQIDESASYRNISAAAEKLLWSRVNEELKQILTSVTLEDLVQEYLRLCQNENVMYYI